MAFVRLSHFSLVCLLQLQQLLMLSTVVSSERRSETDQATLEVEDLPVGTEHGSKWDESTKQLVYEEIGRCYDPSADWSSRESPAPWEDDFDRAVKHARTNKTGPHSQALVRPLKGLPKVVGAIKLLPDHHAVGLTSDRLTRVRRGELYADSHCFDFDYTAHREGDPDPHGCWFFRGSFQPLQELRQCIIGKLDSSPVWRSYKRTVRLAIRKRRRGHRRVTTENPLVIGERDQVLGKMNVYVAYDSIRRADEIVKSVGFKGWESWESGIIAELERKIAKTVTVKSKSRVLENETITAIRTQCFKVEADGAKELPERTIVLKRALPCYQLMWDQVEVGGAPEQPLSNAITMWDPALHFQSEVQRDYDSPPVCARAATALVGERQKRAPGGYSITCGVAIRPSWESCKAPKQFNCICFQYCWREAMRRVCELNPECCAQAKYAAKFRALKRE